MWKSNVRAQGPHSQNSFLGAILRRCAGLVPFLRPRRWQLPSWQFAALILATVVLAPVVQAQTCAYTLSPASVSVSSNGGSGLSVNVSIPSGCVHSGSFTARSNASWIRLTVGGATSTAR